MRSHIALEEVNSVTQNLANSRRSSHIFCLRAWVSNCVLWESAFSLHSKLPQVKRRSSGALEVMQNLFSGHHELLTRVVVKETLLSHQENFIRRNDNQFQATSISDPAGAWMNAGVGGESNTIDLVLQLVDEFDNPVLKCNIIPLRARLWVCQQDYKYVEVLGEISNSDPVDAAGHRRNQHFIVSGKKPSQMCINLNGTGFLSFRVIRTSGQAKRSKFSLEVLPERLTTSPSVGYILKMRFYQFGDRFLLNSCASLPIEVMSKINNLAQKRRRYSATSRAKTHIQDAIECVNNPHQETFVGFYKQELTELQHLISILNKNVMDLMSSTPEERRNKSHRSSFQVPNNGPSFLYPRTESCPIQQLIQLPPRLQIRTTHKPIIAAHTPEALFAETEYPGWRRKPSSWNLKPNGE